MRLKVIREPPSNVTTLVAALPDMGNVAGIALSHLIKILKLSTFAELEAYWPPYVIHKSGRAIYNRSKFRFSKHEEMEHFITFTGDFQPHEAMFLYELCENVVDYVEKLGVKTVITLGAAHKDSVLPEPRVYYAVTRNSLAGRVEECGALALEGEGYITGFNGLLLGIADERGMDAICLLGEIDNPEIRQPKAAKSILKVLAKLLGIDNIDTSELDEEAERIKAQMALAEEYRRLRRTMWRSPPGVI